MSNLVTWFTAHFVDIFAAVFAVEKAAAVIVKLTPSTKDDSVLAKVNSFVSKVATYLSVTPKE